MKERLTALILALSLFLLSGCAGQEEEGIRIYYVSDAGSEYALSALDYELWKDAPASLTPAQLFERLMTAPEESGLSLVIPRRTQLLSWAITDGSLTLDLSESYSDLSGISLTLANFCLILTMTQLETVDQVIIFSDGAPLPGWDKTALSAGDALLTGELQDPILMGFQLWFPSKDRSGLAEDYQETEIYSTDTEDQLLGVLELLVSGPSDPSKMSSPFVGLESYLDWHWADNVCVLELTDSWGQVLLSDELALRSLVNSLCACEGVDEVAFTLGGAAVPELDGTFSSTANE